MKCQILPIQRPRCKCQTVSECLVCCRTQWRGQSCHMPPCLCRLTSGLHCSLVVTDCDVGWVHLPISVKYLPGKLYFICSFHVCLSFSLYCMYWNQIGAYKVVYAKSIKPKAIKSTMIRRNKIVDRIDARFHFPEYEPLLY